MSRTDKDRPYRIKVMDETLGSYVRHDHCDGYCIVQDSPWWSWRYEYGRRRHDCNKRLEGVWYCTRKTAVSRYRRDWRTNRLRNESCWRAVLGDDNDYIPGVYEPCCGHRDIRWEPLNPCICDSFEPAAKCGYELPATADTRWYSRPGPKWYRDHIWNNPERVRERDELKKAVALYNGGGWEDEEFDFDFPNHNHRHRSSWYW